MNEKDNKILYELSKNSRIPLKQLAKRINLSPSSTLNRINSLNKKNILLGTYTIIDNSKLGFQGFRCSFKFTNCIPEEEEKILNWLNEQKEISTLASITGNKDVLIMSWIKNPNDFFKKLDLFKEMYGDKIDDMETDYYLGAHFFPRTYLVENQEHIGIGEIGFSNFEKHDEIDLKILNSIANNSRKNAIEVSNEINVPTRTVIYRIKKMEKNKIIIGYGANININKLGYEYHKLNISFSKNINRNLLLGFALSIDNSIYIDKSFNRFDFELNVEVKNKEELYSIIDDLKKLSGGIRDLEMYQLKKYLKLTVF